MRWDTEIPPAPGRTAPPTRTPTLKTGSVRWDTEIPPARIPSDPELVHDFTQRLARVMQRMREAGYPVTVTSRLRTTAEQQRLYAKGRTSGGSIVTELDGVTKRSHHQRGTGADLAFLVKGQPSYGEQHPWTLLGKIAKEEGLIWGGDWTTLVDRPHVELPLPEALQPPSGVGGGK